MQDYHTTYSNEAFHESSCLVKNDLALSYVTLRIQRCTIRDIIIAAEIKIIYTPRGNNILDKSQTIHFTQDNLPALEVWYKYNLNRNFLSQWIENNPSFFN